jgi:predicted RNase H-like HicB family nuclease
LPFYGDGVSSDVAVSYTVVFEEVGGGWIQARLHELPAVITAAPSREQAAEDVVDALREYLLSLRDVPEPRSEPEDTADTVQLTIALGGR